MKCVAILSSTPDIVFFTADDDYLDQLEEFAERQGMKQHDQAVNMDALQMQLLPIFASLEMLELVESPMHSFTTPAGHSFVLRQFDDFLYLGVSDAEPQEFVSMQLVILRDFLNMLYGPVTALLRPSAASVRLERWKATARLMSTVAEMRKKEQCYLVQAIEIIRINPFVRRICGEAMEQALSKQRGGQIWGSHALLLVGTKLLALYSVPTAPDLQSSDLFLLGLFVQDVLGRDSVPGMEMPDHPPQHTSAVSGGGGGGGGGAAAAAAGGEGGSNGSGAGRRGRLASNAAEEDPVVRTHTSRTGSVHEETFYNAQEGGGGGADSPLSGGEEWADATSTGPSPNPLSAGNRGVQQQQQQPPRPEPEPEFELRGMQRESVFLHTPSNNYAPYIMHCAEVAPSIALVVLSEGHNVAMSDIMHQALKNLNRILELGTDFQRRQRGREVASEIPNRIHMAVRGGTGQSLANAQINGNYELLPDQIEGKNAFQRSTMDMYMFYNVMLQSWCMAQNLPNVSDSAGSADSGTLVDTSAYLAMVSDLAESPENIRGVWEVYDHDLREFHSDPNLQIRCVRGDGALRNAEGRWSKQSTNGLFYCNGPAQCLCGGCNGTCGPYDGCNCTSCKQLDGSRGYGAMELALMVRREQEMARASATESEKALRKESDNLATNVRRICQVGAHIVPSGIADQLLRRVGRLLEIVASKKAESRRWVSVTEIAEGLARSLRMNIGERIAKSNQIESTEESTRMEIIQEHVAGVLKDYIDFLHVKIHRNVTMTAYLEMFPGLVHFIYVDRTQDVMIAPCLTPTGYAGSSRMHDNGEEETLKGKVWTMHAQAQDRLSQGYTTLTTKAGDFRYAYYLWFENQEGEKLTPAKEMGPTTEALDASFYRKLIKRMFPEARPGSVKCYELYLIHLSCVPFGFSATQGQALVRELRDSNPDVQF